MGLKQMAKVLEVCCLVGLFLANVGQGQEYGDNHAKVLIIGAGAAGLQAAKRLHDAGMNDLIIVEAEAYYGGRVHDVPFAGVQIEKGANWAQPGGTGITDTVKRLGISYYQNDYTSIVYRNETGDNVNAEAVVQKGALDVALEKLDEIGTKINKECRDDMSIRAGLRLGGWMPRTAVQKVIDFFEFDSEWADSPDVTSLRATTLTGQISDGNELYINDQGGFKRIFEEITPWLMTDPFKNHLRLNQSVTRVTAKSDGGVEVACTDGTTYTGDYTLVTVSLGVLQNDVIQFTPALPDWKVEKFFQFIMASYVKIFLKFSSQFWDDKEWILHASDRRGYYPVFNNLNADGVFPSQPGNNILVGYCAGDESRRIQKQPWTQTKAEVMAVLRSMYPDEMVPEPEDVFITDWDTNPLYYGSYSNWPVEVSVEGFRQIQSRVGNIFFAGEHTHETLNGYVIGGLESGEREANKILACMKGMDCPEFKPPDKYTCKDPTSLAIAHTVSCLTCAAAAIMHLLQ